MGMNETAGERPCRERGVLGLFLDATATDIRGGVFMVRARFFVYRHANVLGGPMCDCMYNGCDSALPNLT